MKLKANTLALASLLLLITAPVRADVVADQSKVWAPSPDWVISETIAHPIIGTFTVQ